MTLDQRGHEVPDETPVALPVGFHHPPTMVEMIRMYVRREMSQQADAHEMDTFEEAEDFDIEDDVVDPHTPYEAVFDPPAPPPSKPAVGQAAEPPQAPSAGAVSSPAVEKPPPGASTTAEAVVPAQGPA